MRVLTQQVCGRGTMAMSCCAAPCPHMRCWICAGPTSTALRPISARVATRGAFTGRLPADFPRHGFPGHPAYDFVRSETFAAFADLPVFRALAETFFGAPAARIRRTPLRHFLPGRQVASRPHMDRTYIEGVAADAVTIWVPLGDSPMVSGGLLYLEGSNLDENLEQNLRGVAAPNDRSDQRPLSHDLK